MSARQTYYAEALASDNNTSVTYKTMVTLTFTPDANADYLFFWSASIRQNTNLTADAKARLLNTTSVVTLDEQNLESKDLTDWNPVGGFAREQFGASPAEQVYAIQFAPETDTNSVDMQDARLVAVRLDAADAYAESLADGTTALGTFQDKTTLTFTPGSSGDYLLFGSAGVRNQSDGDEMQVQILDPASAAVGLMRYFPKDATNYVPWVTMAKQTLAASSQTFKIQFRNLPNLGDTIAIRYARLLALRLDGFEASYYAEDKTTTTTTTSASYTDKVTLTQTPAAVEHLLFQCGFIESRSASVSAQCQGLDGATVLTSVIVEGQQQVSWRQASWFVAYRATPVAGAATLKNPI